MTSGFPVEEVSENRVQNVSFPVACLGYGAWPSGEFSSTPTRRTDRSTPITCTISLLYNTTGAVDETAFTETDRTWRRNDLAQPHFPSFGVDDFLHVPAEVLELFFCWPKDRTCCFSHLSLFLSFFTPTQSYTQQSNTTVVQSDGFRLACAATKSVSASASPLATYRVDQERPSNERG